MSRSFVKTGNGKGKKDGPDVYTTVSTPTVEPGTSLFVLLYVSYQLTFPSSDYRDTPKTRSGRHGRSP